MPRTTWARALSLVCALATLVIAAGCGSSGDDGDGGGGEAASSRDPIVIGAAIGRTGFIAPYDQPAFASLELAIEELNRRGGILGRRLELRTVDTQSSPQQASVAAKKLIADGAEIIIATCDFDFGSPAALAAQAAGKIVFSLCAESPKWGPQGIGPLAYTPAPAGQAVGTALAQFIEERGWRRVSVMLDATVESMRANCSGFLAKARELGLDVQPTVQFQQTDKTVQSQVDTVRDQRPDAIMMCSYPPGVASVIRQIRDAGIEVPIIGSVAMDGTYWQRAVPGLSNLYTADQVSIAGDDPDPAVNEFVRNYTEATGEPPLYSNVVMGYIDMQLLDLAIREAGTTDGAKVAEKLDQFRDVETLAGPTSYTPTTHIQCYRPLRIMQYTRNRPRYVTTVTPEGDIDLGIEGASCPGQ